VTLNVERAAATADLNVLDELYLHLDREDEPWTVHLEVRAEGTVDEERLEAAVREAAARHPLARARLADTRATDVRYRWEIADGLDEIPLEVADCRDDGELAAVRARLLSATPPLDRPGPFTLALAHLPDGDAIVLNLHHAAGDGMAALRLMGSIARAYAGEDDPLPEIDPLEVRDVRALVRPGSLGERITRSRAALDYLARGMTPPTRIESAGATEEPGYGFELIKLGPEEMERVVARRTGGATVNDVLLGALAVAVRAWNEGHGADVGTTYLMMPINLRPLEWRFEMVGNYASYVSVQLSRDDQSGLDAAIAAATGRTRRIKDDGIAGLIVDLFAAPAALPTAIKKRLQDLIPLTGNLAVDTAVLSNLGRLAEVPSMGDAGCVREVWFSPPGRMPLGASLGAATLGDELFLTLRYRHALLGEDDAREFAALLHRILVK
jgi:NRPS condensation-like uncharacterized protein